MYPPLFNKNIEAEKSLAWYNTEIKARAWRAGNALCCTALNLGKLLSHLSVSQFPQFLVEEKSKSTFVLRTKYHTKARNTAKIPLVLISHITLTGESLCQIYKPLAREGGNQMLPNLYLHVEHY